jgi:uncharacterized membrane protein YdbT with pleckstrin-like domain
MQDSESNIEKIYHPSGIGHTFKYILFLILLIGSIILIIKHYSIPFIPNLSSIIYLIIILVGVIGLILVEVSVRKTTIKLERDSIIINKGVFSKDTTRINYNSITDIQIKQKFLQRLFGIGDIMIGVPGAQQTITQHFSGKGAVHLGDVKGHHAVILENFSEVREIEKIILLRIKQTHSQTR